MTITVLRFAALAMISSSAVLVSGCSSNAPSAEFAEAVVKMTEFKDKMCACKDKDKDCATKVNDELTKWGTEMASKMANNKNAAKPDEETGRKMTAVAMDYGECMTKAMGADSVDAPLDAPLPVPLAPQDSDEPLPPQAPLDVDKAIRSAIDWGAAKRGSSLASIKFEYIDATGTLDRDFGALHVVFGYSSDDDPKRRVGAPIFRPEHHDKCFTLSLRAGSWTRDDSTACAPTLAKPPACQVKAIWAKAIAKGAPKNAVALVDLWGDPATWRVAIEDKPRHIDFSEDFPDDCLVRVEAEPR